MKVTAIYIDDKFTERFWMKVDRSGGDDACWLWRASAGGSEYGHVWCKADGRHCCVDAHKVSFFLAHGSIPDGMQVLHNCNVKRCVNPRHMEAGTPKQNTYGAFRDGLMATKLTITSVKAIIAESSIRHRVELAGRNGVRVKHVKDILRGRAWSSFSGILIPEAAYIEDQYQYELEI